MGKNVNTDFREENTDVKLLYKIYLAQAGQDKNYLKNYHDNGHDNSGDYSDYHNDSHDNTVSRIAIKRVKKCLK